MHEFELGTLKAVIIHVFSVLNGLKGKGLEELNARSVLLTVKVRKDAHSPRPEDFAWFQRSEKIPYDVFREM